MILKKTQWYGVFKTQCDSLKSVKKKPGISSKKEVGDYGTGFEVLVVSSPFHLGQGNKN